MLVGVVTLLAPTLSRAQVKRGGHDGGQSEFVQVNGARLYYEVNGPHRGNNFTGERLPVVLVHGLSLDSRMWDRQFDVLTEHYVTYRFDLRGHGRSDAVTRPVALHEDVVGFMDAMGIQRAHLIGQSLGGNAVTEVAASWVSLPLGDAHAAQGDGELSGNGLETSMDVEVRVVFCPDIRSPRLASNRPLT